MKAVVYDRYGPPEVLCLTDIDKPTPKADEVLIRVHAATVTAGDVNMRGFTFVPPGFGPLPRLMFGIRKPRKPILGVEIAGEIEAVGEHVTAFKNGDAVFGINATTLGAYAEYACRPADKTLAHKPANLSYAEAAAIPFGAGTALYFLRDKADIQPDQRALILGASGGTGSAAVQLARHFGAEVTGVCSTRNVERVRSLGAHHVIDYTQEDFTTTGIYDIVFDAVPGAYSFAQCKPVLTENGIYLAVAGGPGTMLQAALPARGGKRIAAGSPPEDSGDLMLLSALAEQGVLRSLIDRVYPLDEIVEAHRYVDTGRKRGNVVINVMPKEPPEGVES